MKIRKVKWNNNPILGDLVLDFTDSDTGETSSTIVLAGENGTGKSTILETLNTFLCAGSFEPFEYIEYEIGEKIYLATKMDEGHVNPQGAYYVRTDVATGEIKQMLSHKTFLFHEIRDDETDIRHYGSVLSRPRADYKTESIKHTTTQDLDQDKYESDKIDNFTYLKQLIIDIQSQDSDTYLIINREKSKEGISPISYDEFYVNSKMYRFKNAFDSFFSNIIFDSVSNEGGTKNILFDKKGLKIQIDQLSTGEKQIVFRGAFLLKNAKRLWGGIIMIDEPELSLHPKWQEKVLQYYEQLFYDNDGKQAVQMFVASHSPNVINAAFSRTPKNKIIVLDVDTNGQVISGNLKTPRVLPDTLLSEINYQAFDIASTDYHNALYGYIEAEGNKTRYSDLYPKVDYLRERNGTITRENISLSEKIRHIIHHPENHNNNYSESDLRESIRRMREFIIANR